MKVMTWPWVAAGVAAAAAGMVAAIDPQQPSAPPTRPLTVHLASVEEDLWSNLLSGLGPGPVLPSPDIAISFDDMPLLEEGNASASSGMGDFAIAVGDNAHASATGGVFDTAIADGANTTATAGYGNLNDAAVFNYEPAASLLSGGQAVAEYGNGDTALALGDNTATAGGAVELLHPDLVIFGNNDLAAVLSGDFLHASATGGSDMIQILPSLLPETATLF